MRTKIYVLVDPRDGAIRYVGKTSKPLDVRLRGHISEARKGSHRGHWILLLKSLGLVPIIRLVTEVEGDGAQEEIAQIRAHRASHNLTNGTDGGEGLLNPTPEVRAKMSYAAKTRVVSAETRRKQSQVRRGMKRGPESIARMREAQKGKYVSPEHIAYMISRRGPPYYWEGKKLPEEVRKKMSKGKKALHFFRKLVQTAVSNHRRVNNG